MSLAVGLVLSLLAGPGVASAASVTFDVPPFAPYNGSNPPPPWNDTNGNPINAVSPGVFKGATNNTFYMVGLAVAANNNQIADYEFSAGLNCYSSPDLRNWTRQNARQRAATKRHAGAVHQRRGARIHAPRLPHARRLQHRRAQVRDVGQDQRLAELEQSKLLPSDG